VQALDRRVRDCPRIEEIVAEYHEVRELARFDRSEIVRVLREPPLILGVHAQRLGACQGCARFQAGSGDDFTSSHEAHMTNYQSIETQLSSDLGLTRRPIAIAFRDVPPSGVSPFVGTAPSGCTFWKLASEGRTFYTVPADHYNCAIGSHTHSIPLPPERAKELEDTLGFMTSIGYVRMEEVPGIPVLPKTPGAVVYAPLGDTPVDPDVVLFWGPATRVMLLQEAAARAGVAASLTTLGRPTCMALPAAIAHGMVASTGCVGNRVYTDVGEGELYAAVPGRDLSKVAETAGTISAANATLMDYHQTRRRQLMVVQA
jgi:uncharacterized protein (DUF169 family)